MKFFRCKHTPDMQLRGERRIIDRYGWITSYDQLRQSSWKERITEEVCEKCHVRYVSIKKLDDFSYNVGLDCGIDLAKKSNEVPTTATLNSLVTGLSGPVLTPDKVKKLKRKSK